MESYLCNINLILSKAFPLSIKSTFWCGQASDAQYDRNAEKENSIYHLNKTPKAGKSHDLTFFSICTRKTKAQLSARIKGLKTVNFDSQDAFIGRLCQGSLSSLGQRQVSPPSWHLNNLCPILSPTNPACRSQCHAHLCRYHLTPWLFCK